MANKDLSRKPHNITETFWWYEEPNGICLVYQERNEEKGYVRTTQTTIPWRSVRAALTRKDKKP